MREEIITDSGTVCAALSHAEFFAQIESPNFCVFCQLSWGARAKNFTLSHDVRSIGYAESFAHIVIGNQETDSAVAQIEYDILDIVNGFRVDAGERFVQKYILRFGCERPCYLSSSPFAAGKRIASRIADMGDAKFFQ